MFREDARDRFVQPEELPRLLQAIAEEADPSVRAVVLTALLTGARRTEVLTMRWEEVSLTRAEWRIPHTKAGRPHLLPLPHALVVLLRSLPRVEGNPYVFVGQHGVGHLHDMKRAWDRIRATAGIHDVRFHDLRRTVGSWLAASGESLHLIGKVLNHRDVSTTAIYARLNLTPVRQALERHATKMLEAAAPPRTPTVMMHARRRVRATRDSGSRELESAPREAGCNMFPVTTSH